MSSRSESGSQALLRREDRVEGISSARKGSLYHFSRFQDLLRKAASRRCWSSKWECWDQVDMFELRVARTVLGTVFAAASCSAVVSELAMESVVVERMVWMSRVMVGLIVVVLVVPEVSQSETEGRPLSYQACS